MSFTDVPRTTASCLSSLNVCLERHTFSNCTRIADTNADSTEASSSSCLANACSSEVADCFQNRTPSCLSEGIYNCTTERTGLSCCYNYPGSFMTTLEYVSSGSPQTTQSTDLSAGVIVAIVVACLVTALIAVVLVAKLVVKIRQRRAQSGRYCPAEEESKTAPYKLPPHFPAPIMGGAEGLI